MISTIALYGLAAFLEIAGCYLVWAWQRLGWHGGWALLGVAALAGFAFVLTKIDSQFAGRAFAAYGGVYIAAALIWAMAVERQIPDRWDWAGAGLCLIGAALILFGPRAAQAG
jgi:small multidrug resistance family-3 protein